MRRLAPFVAILACAGAASAMVPLPGLVTLTEICATKVPGEIPAEMRKHGASPLGEEEIDRMRLSQSMATAYALLHGGMDQAAVDAQKLKGAPEVAGWILGDATIVTTSQGGEHACTVSTSGYEFDLALTAMKADFGFGEPEKQLTFGETKLAAWKLNQAGPIPGVLLLGADYGDQRTPTIVQFISK